MNNSWRFPHWSTALWVATKLTQRTHRRHRVTATLIGDTRFWRVTEVQGAAT